MPGREVVSWSRNIPELVAIEDRKEQEDGEPGITETAVRTSLFTFINDVFYETYYGPAELWYSSVAMTGTTT
ncbi:hypothetical protein NDU88_002778 [Pleurodeles waltl]|uniref:Uncharacterized protein n=1 Tax=Pleurodeles waltl TaxID=8319 RepID=A0AAV7MPS6_PLEWA|nr:hypothetical protein NDU88_002778 [Pleurodeles waltl]